MKVRFNVKKPSSAQKRKSFAVIRDVVFELDDRKIPLDPKTGKPKRRDSSTVESPEIDTVNEQFLLGKLSLHEALRQIKSVIIPTLKAIEGLNIRERVINEQMFNEDNVRIFHAHWEEKYEDDDNDNRETSNISARNEFKKALQLIDPLPLQSVDKKTLRKHWENAVMPPLARRRYGTRVNELLKAAGRDYTLKLPKRLKNPDVVLHITEADLTKFIPAIEHPYAKLFAKVMFATGVRPGECFAFNEPEALKDNRSIYVHRQMLRNGKIVSYLKNGRPHMTVILAGYEADFQAWASISIDEKRKIRANSAFQRIVTDTAKKVFDAASKQISNHDLRHSYAVHQLVVGRMSVSEIAYLLGDDEQTVKDHYVGFILSDPHIESLVERMDRNAQEYAKNLKNRAKK